MPNFTKKIFDTDPILIIIKTSKGVICGGYSFNFIQGYSRDIEAFLFNKNEKYTINHHNIETKVWYNLY